MDSEATFSVCMQMQLKRDVISADGVTLGPLQPGAELFGYVEAQFGACRCEYGRGSIKNLTLLHAVRPALGE